LRGRDRTITVADEARIRLNGEACKLREMAVGQWVRIRKDAALPVIRFHDLRHTAATLLIADGESVKVASERLGHARVQITLDTYTHVTPTMQKAAAEKMDRLLA
jgi:integrase